MALLVLGFAVLIAGGAVLLWIPSERLVGAIIGLLGTGFAILAVKAMIRRHSPARQTAGAATVESKESLAMVATDWLLALAVPGFIVPVMWQSLRARSYAWDMIDRAGALIFLLACTVWIGWTAIKTIEALRFRRVRLEFDTWPLRIGAQVRGHVVPARGAERLTGIDVKLVLLQHVWALDPDGKGLSYNVSEKWQRTTLATRAGHVDIDAFGFSMVIPSHLPDTDWQLRSDWAAHSASSLESDRAYHSWELRVSASAGSRGQLERRFAVVVEQVAVAGTALEQPGRQMQA